MNSGVAAARALWQCTRNLPAVFLIPPLPPAAQRPVNIM